MSTLRGQTVGGISQLQQAFDDLLTDGIETDINLNGYQITNSGIQTFPSSLQLINKQYADSHYGGISTISNIIESGDLSDSIICNNGGTISVTGDMQVQTGIIGVSVVNLNQLNSAISTASSNYMPFNSSLSTIGSNNPSLSSITASGQQITNVGNNTVTGSSALNLTSGQSLFWSKIPLNQISTNALNTGDIQMNSFGILNISDAILAQSVPSFHQIGDAISALSSVYTPLTNGLQDINSRTPQNIILGNNFITSTATIGSSNQYINSGQVGTLLGSYRPLVDSLSTISTTSPALTSIDANSQLIINGLTGGSTGSNVAIIQDVIDRINDIPTPDHIQYTTGAILRSQVECYGDYIEMLPDQIGGSFGCQLRNNIQDNLGVAVQYTGAFRFLPNSVTSGSLPPAYINTEGQLLKFGRMPNDGNDYIIRNYADQKTYIQNVTSSNAKIEVISDTEIDLTINSQVVAQLTNNGSQGLNITTPNLNIQMTGLGSNQSLFINGQDTTQQTSINLQANTTLNNNQLAIYSGGVTGGNQDNNMLFGCGVYDYSARGTADPVTFIQGSFPGNGISVFSSGQALANNSMFMYGDTWWNIGSTPIQVQFNRKTGYASAISITENNQFASKAYVDASGGGTTTQSLSVISLANPNAANVDMNNFEIINCPGIGLLGTEISFDTGPTINFNQLTLFESAITMGVAINCFIYMNSLRDYANRASDYAIGDIIFNDARYAPISGGSISSLIQYPISSPTDIIELTTNQAALTLNGSLVGYLSNSSGNLAITGVSGLRLNSPNIQTNNLIEYSSSLTATTSNQIASFGQNNGIYMGKTQSLDQISSSNPTLSLVNMNSNEIINVSTPTTIQGAQVASQQFWIRYPTIGNGSVTQYVAVDTPGQINFTVSSKNNMRLVLQNTNDNVLYNPIGDMTIQSQSGPYLAVRNSDGFNHFGGICKYDATYSFSGTQIPDYQYILANFRLASSTLQAIYTANNSALNIGSNLFSSSGLATTSNHIPNKQYVDRIPSINGGSYGGTAGNSQIYIDSTGKVNYNTNQYSTYMTVADSVNDVNIAYQNSIGTGANVLANIVNDATLMSTWLIKTGSTAIYKQLNTAVSSIYHQFTGIAGYTADYSSTFLSNLSSNMIPTIKFNESRYQVASLSPFEVGYVYGFGRSATVAPFSTGTWLLMNGQTFVQATYPALYTWNGNSTTLPNVDDLYMKSFKNSVNTPLTNIVSAVQGHTHFNGGKTQTSVTANTVTVLQTITSGNNLSTVVTGGTSRSDLNSVAGSQVAIQTLTTGNHQHNVTVPALTVTGANIPQINMDTSTTTGSNSGASQNECNAMTWAFWVLAAR